MTIRIIWSDPNGPDAQEEEVRIYRDTAPFDASTLPAILDTLAADVETYDDVTAVANTSYWYAVGFLKDGRLKLAFTSQVFVTASLFEDAATFGSGTVILTGQSLQGTLFEDAAFFGSGAVVPGATTIVGALFEDPAFFGIGDFGQPTFSNADYYITTVVGPDVGAHQGVITQAGGWVMVFDNALTRYNSDWVQQATNANPIGNMGLSFPTVRMIDMFEYAGKLWTVRGTNIHSFDATTMAYDAAVAFTAGPSFAGFSCVSAGPVAGYLYGVQENATVIEVHDLATGNHIADISIGGTLSLCNGLHYDNGYFYFSERPNDLRRCDATGGNLTTVLGLGVTGMDGLAGGDNFIDILMDLTWEGLLRVVAIHGNATQTTGQSSGELIVNGDAETSDTTGWINNAPVMTNVFSAALGAKPDSRVFRGVSGGFMNQSFVFPQEGWGSVDAGTATGDLTWQQVGSSNGSLSMTFFDDEMTQLGQAFYSYTAVGFSAWVNRGGTGTAVPVGTRHVLVSIHAGGTNVYFDTISAELHW